MMIVMQHDATQAQIEAVTDRLANHGLHVQVWPGVDRTSIAAIGDARLVQQMGFEVMDGVERVAAITPPYKLASSEFSNHQPSIFSIQDRIVGPETFLLIAGPCTVESEEQTFQTAKIVADAGASMLRGGAFKPRTSPFAFDGLGIEALHILAAAKEQTGLPIVSELMDISQVPLAEEFIDVVQIGARNMQNYNLLQAAGELQKPVLLKRGLSSSLDELLQAADYILKTGNEQVILCERGIRTFENATRFTLDLGAVAWLKLHTHLPVIVDPSHAPGDRRLVLPLSRAAAAVGADGLIVETTTDPETALCDGPQQLYAATMSTFVAAVQAQLEPLGKIIA